MELFFKMHHPVTLLLSIILLIGIEESVAGENATPRCNDSSVCKKATAKMLQFMDHSADPCKGFHKYVCGNRNVDMNPISKDNVEKIEVYLKKNNTTQTNNTLRIFMDFYRSCVDYDPSFGFMKKMEFIRNHTTTDLTALFTELILTQSMPFFDIGMDINKGDQTYVFQITLPGMRTLKTDLDDWYVFQKVEKECEINVEDSLVGKAEDKELIYQSFKTCKNDLLEKYAEKYLEDGQFAFKNEPNKDGLRWLLKSSEEIREKVPEGVNTSPPMMEKIPIDQLDDKFGVVSWRELFRGLTANSDLIGNEMIQVHFPDYLKGAFDLMKEKHETGELMGILQEFSSFQLYSNIFRTHENKKMFCMDLSQQLMPDITTKIHYELMDPNQNVTMQHFNETFVEMKKTLHNSLQKSIFTDRSKKAFKQKLDDLQLGFITHGNFEITAENYEDVLLSKDYKKDVLTLLKNYRKMIYSLAMASSTAESLLTYFVSPFLNKPKTFYHSSFVVLHPSLSDRIPSVIPKYFGVAKLGILLAQKIAKHFDLIAVGVDTFSNDTYEALVRKTNDLWGDFYWPPMEDNNIVLSEKSPIFNELIADNTAFRMVTDYLKNKMDVTDQLPWIQYDFTAEKITYISVAQEFCRKYSRVAFARDVFEGRRLPFPIKIKNMMENSESYSRTFKCPTNTLETVSSDHWIQFPYIKIEDRPNNY